MTDHTSGGDEPPDSAAETANRPYRTEWRNVDERRRELADEFDSVADLHAADADDLQRVDGIGEKRSQWLRDKL